MKALTEYLDSAEATQMFGARVAQACPFKTMIYLEGELGAGKTTLVRGLLRQLGFEGPVKSPTYTLIEPYELRHRTVFHLDLYRIADPQELDYLGIRDISREMSLCLVEWPDRGMDYLPDPDLLIRLTYVESGREISVMAQSSEGEHIVDKLVGANSAIKTKE